MWLPALLSTASLSCVALRKSKPENMLAKYQTLLPNLETVKKTFEVNPTLLKEVQGIATTKGIKLKVAVNEALAHWVKLNSR